MKKRTKSFFEIVFQNVANNKKKVFLVILFLIAIYSVYLIKEVVKEPEFYDEQNKKLVNDVTQLNPVQMENVYTPKTVSEVQEVIKNSSGKISIGGTRKSMGGQTATPDGVQIDMREFNKILSLSTSTKEITVQAGARWYDIQKYIDPYGLSVMIMQSYNNFSVGGSISTNVHGRYIGYGPLIESVQSFRLITADGKLWNVSRTENPNLFYAVVGGYGAFGVITDATLKLADNTNLERKIERVKVADYVNYFRDNIEINKNIIFQNADIYVNNYTDANSVVWVKSSATPTEKESFISKDDFYALNRFSWFAMSEFPFGNQLRQYVFDPILNRKVSVHSRNYEASYDVYELEPSSRKESTYVLQEYFIPIEKFNEFVPKMKKVFQDNCVNVLNISIRHAKKDEGSLLAWAPKGDVFAFVVYYKQGTDVSDKLKVAKWTREMIDQIISVEGAYYLPYQEHATYGQFRKVYRDADKFFEIKQKYDPSYRFTNTLWDKYYKEYLNEKNGLNYEMSEDVNEKIVEKYPFYSSRKQEQTYLTLPEWYLVYSYKELAKYLKNGNSQHSFDYLQAISTFWKYTSLGIQQSGKMNYEYLIVDLVIGTSFSVEYTIKFIYENTIGRMSALFGGYVTEEDKFIANSWDKFATSLDVLPWYEYDYWTDFKNIWTENTFFKKTFIRSTERKIALSISYFIKNLYARAIKFSSNSAFGIEENKTLLVVANFHLEDYPANILEKIKVLEPLYAEGAIYLIETPRYKEFSSIVLELAEKNVHFLKIMNNNKIMLTYISNKTTDGFEYFEGVQIISKEKLAFGSGTRVVLDVKVVKLHQVIKILQEKGVTIEHIYDY